MKTTDIVQYLVRLDRLSSEVDRWFVASDRRGKKREIDTTMLLLELRSLARQVTFAMAQEEIEQVRTHQLIRADFEGTWIQ